MILKSDLTGRRWHMVSASMTPTEQRAFLHMRRTEELAKVEEIEAGLARRIVQLWWMPGKFGYVISGESFVKGSVQVRFNMV